jgi:hypothetical protein
LRRARQRSISSDVQAIRGALGSIARALARLAPALEAAARESSSPSRSGRRQAGKLVGRTADAALGLLDRAMEISRDPERVARKISLGLLSKALPGPMRNALWLARSVASFGLRQRW